jgi:diaminohydroxyphosphoribosylaminopyrimidine deaminase/5-amino-6-(5-phosphoribosylamino)uracil reductase
MTGSRERESEIDREMMARALRAAKNGRPSPNPHVGAVITDRSGEILSIGHHARCGAEHAEVVALKRAGKRSRGATLYVTMEPCNHVGRTGPCTEAIIGAGLKRVVTGCPDPAPPRPGAVRRLRAAGIEVVTGVLEDRARRLVADFAKVTLQGQPLVTLKAAVTLDGRLAGRNGDSKWITGESARREAHRYRARNDAVLVGIGTVLADDPRLTVRGVRGRDPIRVVMDTRLRTPPGARLLDPVSGATALIFHGKDAGAGRKRALERAGAELVTVPVGRDGHLNLRAALARLARRGVLSILAEGGARIHGALLDGGLADRVAVFVAPRIMGDGRAPSFCMGTGRKRVSDAWRLRETATRRFDEDILITGDISNARA